MNIGTSIKYKINPGYSLWLVVIDVPPSKRKKFKESFKPKKNFKGIWHSLRVVCLTDTSNLFKDKDSSSLKGNLKQISLEKVQSTQAADVEYQSNKICWR